MTPAKLSHPDSLLSALIDMNTALLTKDEILRHLSVSDKFKIAFPDFVADQMRCLTLLSVLPDKLKSNLVFTDTLKEMLNKYIDEEKTSNQNQEKNTELDLKHLKAKFSEECFLNANKSLSNSDAFYFSEMTKRLIINMYIPFTGVVDLT